MNILLLDDQEIILEATKKLVNWEKIGVKEVYTANSAAAARKILKVSHVDIILADIEMPVENGVQFRNWQAEVYPDIMCIFLTSHADFHYAQNALKSGVFDYILQPASFSDIEASVSRCIKFIEDRTLMRHKSQNYDETKSELLKSDVFAMFHQRGKFQQMEKWRQDTRTEGDEWWFLPSLVEVWNEDVHTIEKELEQWFDNDDFRSWNQYGSVVITCLNEREIGVLIYTKNDVENDETTKRITEEKMWELCEKYHCELNFYIGQYAKDDLQEKIGQLMEFVSGNILKRNEAYLVEPVKSFAIRKPDGVQWSKWMLRNDTVLVRNQIANMLNFAQQERQLTVDYMRQIIHAFLEACSIACYEQGAGLSELFTKEFTYEQMLQTNSSVEKLKEGVEFCLHQYGKLVSDKTGVDISSASVQERIREILRYLDENMERMISRREAAKYVFLNEDYFSRKFKEETGLGYKEYVLKQKMEYAKKLLADTDLPIVLVASKIGYENYTNFTQMFRKYEGITPTEYRKKYQN